MLSSFNGKIIVLWLTENFDTNVTKVKISNYSSTITIPAVQYNVNQRWKFTTEDGELNRLMFSPNFYDFDSEQFHKVMLQEKLSGSYIFKIEMKDIFEFNHIDRSLSESDVGCLKDFYTHYHKKYWCFKRSYKRYKLLDETLTLTGGGLVVIGTITGGITPNPIILGVINGAGVIGITKKGLKCHK